MMKINKKALTILNIGHFITDINQGALPALLPYFKDVFSLSYAMAGGILLAANLASSIIQPAFGYLSDKRPLGWLLPSAPLAACLGFSLTGIMPHYFLLILCAIFSGFGIAGFHPEAFKTAHFFSGDKKATGISIFAVGGNLGIAVGPILALSLVASYGLKGTLAMIIPGILITVVLSLNMPMLSNPGKVAYQEARQKVKPPLSRNQKITFSLLIGIATLRAWIQIGLIAYIPFYYINYLKGNPLYAGKLVSTFLLAGCVGTLIGAPLADRLGHKKYLLITMALTFPLLLLFYNSSGLMVFFLLGISGMVIISGFAVTTVMAQAILPHHLGIASGMMVGFTISAGGIGVTLLGAIADRWGVPMAIKAIFVLPLIALGLILLVRYPLEKGEDGMIRAAPLTTHQASDIGFLPLTSGDTKMKGE